MAAYLVFRKTGTQTDEFKTGTVASVTYEQKKYVGKVEAESFEHAKIVASETYNEINPEDIRVVLP